MEKVFCASRGSVGGTRGRSSFFTVGSAARAGTTTVNTTNATSQRNAFIAPEYRKSPTMLHDRRITRRDFLVTSTATAAAAAACVVAASSLRAQTSPTTTPSTQPPDPIID